MLRERLLVAIVLVPLASLMIGLGGWYLPFAVALIMGMCAWEYWRMARMGGFSTSPLLLVGGSTAIILLRHAFGLEGAALAASLLILLAFAYHTLTFQNGEERSATHFAIAVAGLFYIGWLGSYIVALRQLPDGDLWMLTGLTAAWFADSGAYFIGVRYGRHKIIPRVSPHKSWEGYLGGIVVAVIFTALLAWLWSLRAPQITALNGALLGLVVGSIAPLGDLGESMLKRQFGVKDTSKLLPGHGGMLDRADSTLWAAVISYYIITFFML